MLILISFVLIYYMHFGIVKRSFKKKKKIRNKTYYLQLFDKKIITNKIQLILPACK